MNYFYNPKEQERMLEARESFSGRLLTDAQFDEAMALTGIIEREIKKNGAFKEKLGDYAHAFSRTEHFVSAKAETVVRDLFKARTGMTMNQMREELMERVKTLRAKLRVDIPIVVPATQDEGPNKAFDDYYNITRSRTLMLADGENTVKFSAVAPPDLFALNQSILELVDDGDAPATDALATDDDDG